MRERERGIIREGKSERERNNQGQRIREIYREMKEI
jgi:hypothetical protein